MANLTININSLIYPLFVKQGVKLREPIHSMPNIYKFSPDMLIKEVKLLLEVGINKILLFGIAEYKDDYGSSGYIAENIVSYAIKLLKNNFPKLTIMSDVCLCAYTSHGHCAVLNKEQSKLVSINKQQTLLALEKIALSHAAAGADYVAPSAMAKNQVLSIRKILDENGYEDTKIMGYSAKFASQFYGPFRDAAKSAPKFADRSQYQLNCANKEKALIEIEDDINEGADIVIVKPALAYLDIISEAREKYSHTLAAYNVSGEYSMVKLGAQHGYWNEKDMVFEIITAIYRAGANMVITYHALDLAKWLLHKPITSK